MRAGRPGSPAASRRRSASSGERPASWSRLSRSCVPRRLSSRGSTTRYAMDLPVHPRPPRSLRGRADLPRAEPARRADRPEDVLGAQVPAAVEAGCAGRGPDRDPCLDLRAGQRWPQAPGVALRLAEDVGAPEPAGRGRARCTVERLMRANGWRGVTRARTVRTTIPDPAHTRAPDLVQRNFKAGRPGKLHVADFTYVPLHGGGFGYTAFCIDAFARLLAAWECSLSKQTAFVERAIRQAAAFRAPQGHPLDHAIHHSHPGSQY